MYTVGDIHFVRPDGQPRDPVREERIIDSAYTRASAFYNELQEHQNLTGMDVPALNAFMASYRLPPTSVMMFDERLRDQVNEVGQRFGIGTPVANERGLANILSGIGIVYRDAEAEAWNGPDEAGRVFVHEGVHLATNLLKLSYPKTEGGRFLLVQNGFIEGERGRALEEALPDLLGARFIIERTGSPRGFVGDIEAPPFLVGTPEGNLTIPPAYLDMDGPAVDEWVCSGSSVPAVGFEMLVDEDPTLLDALIAARCVPAGEEMLAKKVDQFEKGLFKDLSEFDDSDDGLYGFAGRILRTLA